MSALFINPAGASVSVDNIIGATATGKALLTLSAPEVFNGPIVVEYSGAVRVQAGASGTYDPNTSGVIEHVDGVINSTH